MALKRGPKATAPLGVCNPVAEELRPRQNAPRVALRRLDVPSRIKRITKSRVDLSVSSPTAMSDWELVVADDAQLLQLCDKLHDYLSSLPAPRSPASSLRRHTLRARLAQLAGSVLVAQTIVRSSYAAYETGALTS